MERVLNVLEGTVLLLSVERSAASSRVAWSARVRSSRLEIADERKGEAAEDPG
jgi:hypothetical protein